MLTFALATTPMATPDLEVRRVTFRHDNTEMVGRVFMPKGVRPGQRLPAVIVTGAWFTIKEQMPTTYAVEFARRGYAAMVFDFRGFGESGGRERNTENPMQKATDITAAARFFAREPYVDATRLSGYAMCASTGAMGYAINGGAPLRAFANSAPWIQDPATVVAVYGGEDGVRNLTRIGDEAMAHFRATGEIRSVPAAGPQGSDAIMQQAPYYTDPKRGMIREWENRFALKSWTYWLKYDSLKPAASLKVPTLVMHSDNAALPDMARRFYAEINAPKAIWWGTESQMDYYDDPWAVNRNVGQAIRFFDLHLGSGRNNTERHIEETVLQMVNGVDAKAWGGVRAFFAPTLNVDYSSMGGAKGTVQRDDLLRDWETFHAKFRNLRHTYTDFSTVINGDDATTWYRGTATLTHGTADQPVHWTVNGNYTSTLRRSNGRWIITGTKFEAREVLGTPPPASE